MKRLFLVLLTLFVFKAHGQITERFNPDTIKTVTLDSSINIKAERLSVETFIKAVINDTSFYQSFRDMKKYSFIAENRIYTYDKKNKVDGKIYRKIRHNNAGPYKMETLYKEDSGNLYKKNGKYQLYTVEMFDYIFMNAYSSDFIKNAPVDGKKGAGGNEGYKDKLKTLIFNPGRPIKGIPFIGGKTEIFTANMRQYYDYSFTSATYLDSIPVYRFIVSVKPDMANSSSVMIKELVTIFDKRNFNILGRYIDMKYSNMLFDFDVKMNIEMGYFGEDKLPTKITYQGNWNVPFKKEERASFLILHKDYKLESGK